MNRTALFGMLLAATCFASAQDLTQKISVDIPASRASSALAVLGKAAGITLQPAGNMKNDVLVIRATDVSVDDIMKRIAQAESAHWVPQSGLYLLTRENYQSVEQERAELKDRTDLIVKAIAKLNASVAKQPKFDATAAQKLADETKRSMDQMMQDNGSGRPRMTLSAPTEKTPIARATAKILASIDPAKLAQIGPNQRVVFSTNPTPMQKGLGAGGQNAFQQFVEEQRIYTQAYNANQPQDGNTRFFSFNGFGTPTMGSGDPRLGLGIGLVVVQRRFGDGLSVEILAADTKYDTIASGNYSLQLPEPEVTIPPAGSEQPLQISAEAKEMAKAFRGDGGGGPSGGPVMVRAISLSGGPGGEIFATSLGGGSSNIKISPELKKKVLNPEQYEPMAFVPGEAMLALSKQTKKNLVALLPDYCFGSMTRQFADPVTATQLLASLSPTHTMLAKQEGDWIVVSPGLPYTGRANTVNRAALGSLLRSLDKTGSLRLDEVAAFALAQSKVPGMEDFDIFYSRLINESATEQSMMPLATGSISLYRFYGSLSSSQRQAIGSSQQIPLMNLSSQQTAYVADMLYNSMQGPNVQLDNPTQPGGGSTTSTFAVTVAGQAGRGAPMFFGGGLSAKTERTIVLPNGVPSDGFMLGTVTSQPVAQGINSQTGSTAFLEASSLAFSRNASTQPELASFPSPTYDKYRMAHQSTFSVRFLFSPRVMMMRSLNDTSPDADSKPGTYDSLPADFRAKVDQAAEQIKRAMDRVPNGIPGRGQNPPPPSQ